MTEDREVAGVAAPFGAGSVSLAVSTFGADAGSRVRSIVEQAAVAADVGFDGVTIGEHHDGFGVYFPQPLLACAWVLDSTSELWAAPCPMLLGIRRPELIAEEAAWLAARHPGRLGLGVGSGYRPEDFAPFGVDLLAARAQYEHAVGRLLGSLSSGTVLRNDLALQESAGSPLPVVTAASTRLGMRIAARQRVGVAVVGAPVSDDRPRRLLAHYRAHGGNAPVVWTRRVWIGHISSRARTQLERRYQLWNGGGRAADPGLFGTADEVGRQLVQELESVGGPWSLSVRFEIPGARIDESIAVATEFASEVLPRVRDMSGGPASDDVVRADQGARGGS